jgi:site-specific DNA-methyltransferase (adenine-specific)
VFQRYPRFDTIFADPPDNLRLGYDACADDMPEDRYRAWLAQVVRDCVGRSGTVWVSFSSRYTFLLGAVVDELTRTQAGLEAKPCTQVFTFGQHNQRDLGNNHRPLWRLRWEDAPLFPDAVRVPSWRQLNGDKRADSRGRVPGDVFDFPRVTGNSKQRRAWHPTQLHEGLVERCLKLTTPPGGLVFDPFAGTGTTLRVCKRLGFSCATSDVSGEYCRRIREENGMS